MPECLRSAGNLNRNYRASYTASTATRINNSGQIVGDSEATSYYDVRATLWNGTSTIDLNTFVSPDEIQAGWVLVVANDINDKGTIVGTAMNSKTGIYKGFVLSIPEPETYAMLLVGLGLIGFVYRRKNQKSS